MTSILAQRLKTETRVLHTSAERSTFMGVLIRGKMNRRDYVMLLRNLQPIYAALEPALDARAKHPSIAPIYLPALWRTHALERDLVVLQGAAWRDEIALEPVTARYVERLNASEPEALLAHAYVRYLGDLSGGQMLRAIVARSMQLEGNEGTAFYDFGDAVQTRALTDAFRAGLEAVVLDETGVDSVVEEAKLAFQLHQTLFDSLALAAGLSGR